MQIPLPGKPVRGSRSGRPIMALLDLLGRRAALRILWELSRTGEPLTFRALQAAANTNPSVLNTRVKELRAAGLVAREPRGYALSEAGERLLEVLLPLHAWAEGWAARRAFRAGGNRQAKPRMPRRRSVRGPAIRRRQRGG
jgi:DNA-binding HxlR family transcriptional regulator